MTYFDKALAIDPLDISSLKIKAYVYQIWIPYYVIIKKNKYEDAITWFDKALAINPDDVSSLINKGRDPNITIFLGDCLFILFDENNATLQFSDEAHLINQQNVVSLQSKGDCLYSINIIERIREQQHYKQALFYYEKSLKINPNEEHSKQLKIFCEKN